MQIWSAVSLSTRYYPVYARYQHEELQLNHPRGGQAKYLEQPLHAEYRGYLDDIARRTLETGPVEPMIDAMENLAADQLGQHAPLEFGNLRESGHPSVTSGGETVYDREPVQRRLTEAELREQHRTGIRHRHLHPEQYGE
ncbi:hypothetical protein [Amycolatopsis taiwanensis]|uniref:hypothetical protein n=1 Tax=Amycolatopsis taiwanensis TaxID=342230 RepID=UPI0004808F08|nr:hypothetical protein [Amycolatopsis taiwanensis]